MKSPFLHDEIEVKKKFLELARDFSTSKELEKELASVMLYANLSEYLAYHLLESLRQVVFSGSKAFWNGVVYYDSRGASEKMTIGQIAIELKTYGFPSKELIIPKLKRIAENRNKVMHNMLRTPGSQLDQIDEAISQLSSDVEDLVDLIDDIYRGLPPSNITTSVDKKDGVEVEGVVDKDGEMSVKQKASSSVSKK